jgi:hypothetical protein
VNRPKIVITNYHTFKLREKIDLLKGGLSLLQLRGEELNTLETEGQILQRAMPNLMGMENILVLNDEAHHCYREKPEADDEELKGDDRKEAEKNLEAARVWISGLESVNRQLGGRIRAMEPWPLSYMLSRAARPMLAMRRGLDITPGPIRSGHTRPWAALGDAQFAAQSRRLPSVGVAGSTFSAKCPGLRAQDRKIGAACHRRDRRELQASTGLPRA